MCCGRRSTTATDQVACAADRDRGVSSLRQNAPLSTVKQESRTGTAGGCSLVVRSGARGRADSSTDSSIERTNGDGASHPMNRGCAGGARQDRRSCETQSGGPVSTATVPRAMQDPRCQAQPRGVSGQRGHRIDPERHDQRSSLLDWQLSPVGPELVPAVAITPARHPPNYRTPQTGDPRVPLIADAAPDVAGTTAAGMGICDEPWFPRNRVS